jgi:hypothetical protein
MAAGLIRLKNRNRAPIGRHGLCAIVAATALAAANMAVAETPSSPPGAAGSKASAVSAAIVPRAKALGAYAQALAMSAAAWGSPLVTMYSLRYNDVFGPHPKAAVNAIWRMQDISTPELAQQAGYVTPNVNTLYGFGFLDLSAEPVILTTPDSHDRYYMVEIVDFWTNAFAYAGGVEAGYKGGKYAIVGPGWKGQLPPDVKRIDAPTRWVLIQPRVHVTGRDDLPAARKVLDAITVQGLGAATGKPAAPAQAYNYAPPVLTDPKLPVSALAFKDPLQFWEILADAMIENPPPPDQVTALLPLFAPLGIVPGQPWRRSTLAPVVVAAMEKVAREIPSEAALLPSGSFRNGWLVSWPTIGNFGTDYLNRAVIARNGLTANTPREAIYIGGLIGSDGSFLSGANRYTVTFKSQPPFVAPGFWSVTAYDQTNNYTAPNSINRYALGSDDKALKFNSDGSLTLYLQKDDPGSEHKENWLPTPAGTYYLILRSYAPGESLIRSQTNDPDAFPLPAIVKRE